MEEENLASLLLLPLSGPLSGPESPCIQPFFFGHGFVLAHFTRGTEVAGGTLRSGTAIWEEEHRHTDNKEYARKEEGERHCFDSYVGSGGDAVGKSLMNNDRPRRCVSQNDELKK